MSATIDIDALARFVAEVMHLVTVELEPIDVNCAWPVYKARPLGAEPFFVKLTATEPAERTLSFLREMRSPLLPRVLTESLPVFERYRVLCLEWRPSTRVNAEEMNDAQAASFLEGCVSFSKTLNDFTGTIRPLEEGDSPRGEYNELVCYSLRHPLCAKLLNPLLSLPKEERDFSGHRLVTIHGDLQPRNYGFTGDSLSVIYDTDDLTEGLACEDATYAFTERLRKSSLSSVERKGLIARFLAMVSASPWPKEEWLLAVNHARLTIAARRLAKRPNSLFIALDIRRRDKPLRALADALRSYHA